MLRIQRTNSDDEGFISLEQKLDIYLAISDGDEHDFYDQLNKLDAIKNVIVLYLNEIPVGCGAFKEYQPGIAELRRMFVDVKFRNRNYAGEILRNIEAWAQETGYTKLILETGKRQFEAINFYKKNRFELIDKYPPYENMENSVCFEKLL
ncbi:GNAT family N-acetyltransferase [Christiangramia forsetii]|uniref:GNAT family acetyltransferase n=2 Tax=Christiangramia forsetii TaxID=411153 RepID=A0M1R0_CHRFK|nr:GNAT family N-acetyltransferase [Christiangramia forsetii]GGG41896.1 N-acetyltransferase [Christiangramia forsetii]CAL66555.1 GNAT family acetyltransferase [Christiangramia forsetii KT0803]